jgi:hypothetical protein
VGFGWLDKSEVGVWRVFATEEIGADQPSFPEFRFKVFTLSCEHAHYQSKVHLKSRAY